MGTSRKWEQSLKDLEDEFRRLVKALDLIVDLDRRIFQTSFDRDSLLEEMLKGLRNLIGAEYAQILLRRGSELIIVHSTQPSDKGRVFKIEECVCGVALAERRTVASGNVELDYPTRYQWILGRGDDGDHKMVSEIAVPIYAHIEDDTAGADNDLIAGVINIESPIENAFHWSQIELVEKFALQAGAAINNARLNTGLALTVKLAENIQTLSQQPAEALRSTLEQLSVLFQEGAVVQFLIYDRASDSLIIESSTLQGTEGNSVLVSDSFSGLVIKNNGPVRSNHVTRDYPQLFKDTVGDAGYLPTQSELAVPIKEDGRIIGILNVESSEKDAFSRYDEYMLTVIASTASVWTRIHKSKSLLALEKMATVGNIAGHLIHTLNSGLLPLELIAKNLQQISAGQDEGIQAQLQVQIDWLMSVAPSVDESINKLQDMYVRARELHEDVNVNQLARQVVKDLVTREDIQIHWELDPQMPNLRISPGIYHVFWNLVSNAQAAIKADQPGELTIGTRIVYGRYTNQIEAYELWVRDNGKGISEDMLEHIFRLDYSSKEGRITGYGLWWVDTFVDRWEGKRTVESEVGRGTTMRIWFPLTSEGVAAQVEQEDKEDV
ncbi:MAG TPA: GAF domain-containing protein [Pyrinomonadaceae bacterium]|jgi:signal transduction histidine kinase|nr:GAF domain-containing protein [Pyrinomonadaceae bacterium]